MGVSFADALHSTLNNEFNYSTTENGALGYRTTGTSLLDLNFAVASLRKATPDEIAKRFMAAFFEDKLTAMKWMFYARDIRYGMGERRLFRSIMAYMAINNPEYIAPVIELVPEYGRYDDLWCLLDTELAHRVLDFVRLQLRQDISDMHEGLNISLLAKWMPSGNASSALTKHFAKIIRNGLEMSNRTYRVTLSEMRRYLRVVEQKMSKRQWSEIDYEAVPSRANLLYNKAFLRNDEVRRREFLEQLTKGEAKINAGTLFPHDIVHKYTGGGAYRIEPHDATLEELWRALPNNADGMENTIVVADGSGSMTVNVGGSVSALDVANALAIYFAERSSGQFRNKYITFSTRPQFVDFSNGKTLREKIQIALQHSEIADTNIEAVFDLILTTAQRERMSQSDLPKNILIISDMEFNSCVTGGSSAYGRYSYGGPDARLFEAFKQRYAQAGYQLPRLVFWNVASRTGTIPVKENDLGVALVSGFSTNVAKMVMSGKTDPYECLLETLNGERYEVIGLVLDGALM